MFSTMKAGLLGTCRPTWRAITRAYVSKPPRREPDDDARGFALVEGLGSGEPVAAERGKGQDGDRQGEQPPARVPPPSRSDWSQDG